jgi:hypothetical protein
MIPGQSTTSLQLLGLPLPGLPLPGLPLPELPRSGQPRSGQADRQRVARLVRPRNPDQLHGWISAVLGFSVPRLPLANGHDAPFEYLVHSFFEQREPRDDAARPRHDCIVWANRGGGKTQLGAIATLLDMLFKPGIQIRILGGSLDQSRKMYGYLRGMLDSAAFADLVRGRLTSLHVELRNGSRVEILTQSERSVRGQRVHRLRCDEVELFNPGIWEAAQLATRSGWCGDTFVRASIEALSTMHRPFGLMQRLIDDERASRRIFRWNALDVIEHCPPQRECSSCPLWAECRGMAKLPRARGFLSIDDLIDQRQRVGVDAWESEMLCQRPSRSDSVYRHFDPAVHISRDEELRPIIDEALRQDQRCAGQLTCIGGLDFGYRGDTVFLWAIVDARGVLHVFDELATSVQTIEQVIDAVQVRQRERGWPRVQWIGADPSGHARNDQTGRTKIQLWRDAGFAMRTMAMKIEPGIDLVRARLRRADGTSGLRIHERCARLIEAMTKYHYPPNRPHATQPVKDGDDHAADALRYMIVNLDAHRGRVEARDY